MGEARESAVPRTVGKAHVRDRRRGEGQPCVAAASDDDGISWQQQPQRGRRGRHDTVAASFAQHGGQQQQQHMVFDPVASDGLLGVTGELWQATVAAGALLRPPEESPQLVSEARPGASSDGAVQAVSSVSSVSLAAGAAAARANGLRTSIAAASSAEEWSERPGAARGLVSSQPHGCAQAGLCAAAASTRALLDGAELADGMAEAVAARHTRVLRDAPTRAVAAGDAVTPETPLMPQAAASGDEARVCAPEVAMRTAIDVEFDALVAGSDDSVSDTTDDEFEALVGSLCARST